MRNYYKILGIPRNATLEQIITAYIEKENAGLNEHDMSLVREAYMVLTNPALRKTHDRFLDRMAEVEEERMKGNPNARLMTLTELAKEVETLTEARRSRVLKNSGVNDESIIPRPEEMTPVQKVMTAVYLLNIWTPLVLAWLTGNWLLLLTYLALPLYVKIPYWIFRRRRTRFEPGI